MRENTVKSRKIRIFLSSTFNDMQDERNYLVQYIFPQIDEYCRLRSLEFIPIDLRWGITEEESRNAAVLSACLEEVDNSRPYFIAILGDRYGWTPGIDELTNLGPELRSNEDWLFDCIADGASITEMEIDYGVLRNLDIPHAAFFIRDPSVEVTDDKREMPGTRAEAKLKKLKAKIRNQNKYPVYDYTNVKDLGEEVKRQLLKMIDEEFPISQLDAEDAIIAPHEEALERRTNCVVCDISAALNDFDLWIKSKKKVFLVKGCAGIGTSTVLAYSVNDLRKKYRANIIYFDFESISAGSQPIEQFLAFMAIGSNQLPSDKWSMVAIDNISILNVDDLNKLTDWIDKQLDNVHIALAVTEGTPAYDSLSYTFDCPTSKLHGFTKNQRCQLVDNYIARYGKKLTSEQRNKIIENERLKNVTDLRMILDTIVSYGDYKTLDARIDEVVKEAEGDFLFWHLLQHNQKVYDKAGLLMDYAYGTIAVSFCQEGISEVDIMAALNISQARWSAVRPAIIRFCKGSSDNLRLIKHGWMFYVKRHWATNLRAIVGKMISDYLLSDPQRRNRSARLIAGIYNDIWHLFDVDEIKSKHRYKEYEASIKSFSITYDAVISVAPGELDGMLGIWKKTPLQFDPLMGRTEAQIITYYTKLAQTSSAFNKNDRASQCYARLAEILDIRGSQAGPLYRAMAAIERGKASIALKELDKSGLLPPIGLSKMFSKKDESVSPMLRLMALSLKGKAYAISGNNKLCNLLYTIFDQTDKVIDQMPNVQADFYRRVLELALSAVTLSMKFMAMFGTYEVHKELEIIIKEGDVDRICRYIGLYSEATYDYTMSRAILSYLYGNNNDLNYWTYYAMKCASRIYGERTNNVIGLFNNRSYQYNQAANLYAVSYWNATKKYIDWNNTGYVQRHYNTLPDEKYFGGIPESEVEPAVKRMIKLEKLWFAITIRSIQPEYKLKEIDVEIENLRRVLR